MTSTQFALLAMVCWALQAVGIAGASRYLGVPLLVVLICVLIEFVTCVGLALHFGIVVPALEPKAIVYLVLGGIGGVAGFIAYAMAMGPTGASAGRITAIAASYPVVVALIAPMVLAEPFKVRHMAAALVTGLGVWLASSE